MTIRENMGADRYGATRSPLARVAAFCANCFGRSEFCDLSDRQLRDIGLSRSSCGPTAGGLVCQESLAIMGVRHHLG